MEYLLAGAAFSTLALVPFLSLSDLGNGFFGAVFSFFSTGASSSPLAGSSFAEKPKNPGSLPLSLVSDSTRSLLGGSCLFGSVALLGFCLDGDLVWVETFPERTATFRFLSADGFAAFGPSVADLRFIPAITEESFAVNF